MRFVTRRLHPWNWLDFLWTTQHWTESPLIWPSEHERSSHERTFQVLLVLNVLTWMLPSNSPSHPSGKPSIWSFVAAFPHRNCSATLLHPDGERGFILTVSNRSRKRQETKRTSTSDFINAAIRNNNVRKWFLPKRYYYTYSTGWQEIMERKFI